MTFESLKAPPENRLAFLGELAAGLAHEIKNPLSTIRMNLELLREDWKGASGEREKKTLRKFHLLEREVRRLEEIVESFLRFSRGLDLKLVRSNLNPVVSEVLELIEPELARKSIQLRSALDPAAPDALVDTNQLKQALVNVIVNAEQAMERGGDLIVRTKREDGETVIDVIDTGSGIAPEALPRIFQPYFSTKKGGTGLGLPMTRRIVEEHGGRITVASEPGRGTQVTMRFPAAS
jgi:signal transduction histidine kinase